MSPKKPVPDRRRFPRFPVMEGMIEPITVNFDIEAPARGGKTPRSPKNQPAILTNLSAGGMSLLMFLQPPKSRTIDMVLSIPGLTRVPIEGKVVRISEKGQTYNVGIAFTRIARNHQDRIVAMAQDNLDCETRISLKLPEACVRTCTFHALCAKPQKGPYWPQ